MFKCIGVSPRRIGRNPAVKPHRGRGLAFVFLDQLLWHWSQQILQWLFFKAVRHSKIDKRFIDLIDSFFKSNDIDPDGCDANDDYLDYSFANQITEGMVYSFLNEFDVELPYLVRKQLDPEF